MAVLLCGHMPRKIIWCLVVLEDVWQDNKPTDCDPQSFYFVIFWTPCFLDAYHVQNCQTNKAANWVLKQGHYE